MGFAFISASKFHILSSGFEILLLFFSRLQFLLEEIFPVDFRYGSSPVVQVLSRRVKSTNYDSEDMKEQLDQFLLF